MRSSLVYILGYRSGSIVSWYRFLVGFGGRSNLGQKRAGNDYYSREVGAINCHSANLRSGERDLLLHEGSQRELAPER